MRSLLGKAIFLSVSLLSLNSCSSTPKEEESPAIPAAPEYIGVSHPTGFQISEIESIFKTNEAPQRVSLDCDADFRFLEKKVQTPDELKQGAQELVSSDPIKYHFCFYSKLVSMHQKLKDVPLLEDRQKNVLEAYSFLVPIAHGFKKSFNDSRYLRWAIYHYRLVSEWVFYRKLDLGEKAVVDLLGNVSNQYVLYLDKNAKPQKHSVLLKYGIIQPSSVDPVGPALETPDRAPAALPNEIPDAVLPIDSDHDTDFEKEIGPDISEDLDN